MAYAACLLYLFVVYIRPGEIIPGWIGFPFLEIAGAIAVVAGVVSLVLAPRKFADLPADWCVLGFCGAAVLSSPANGWFGGIWFTTLALLPVLLSYLLIRISVQRVPQLRMLMTLIILMTLFQAVNGIVQYHTGTGFGGSTAFTGLATPDEAVPEEDIEKRVRGTGIFGDPNDLALSLVVVLPFLYSRLLNKDRSLAGAVASAASIGVIVYALVLTQSRGGLLGMGVLSAAYAYRRFKSTVAVVVAVALLGIVLAAGPSRFQQLEASEDSAQGRIQSWAEGLQMFRSRPILGVGFANYTEYNELVAHNSFVHSFAELGFVGGYFFVGLFYWMLLGNGATKDIAGGRESTLALDAWASGLGLLTCVCFLSRQYSPAVFVPLAIGAARVAVERTSDENVREKLGAGWGRLAFISAGVLVGTYVLVRVFAVWSS
jgi:putative inorganic carbon (hco3(-)) transporter